MSPLFDLPQRATKAGDSLLVKKVKEKTKAGSGSSIKAGGSLLERLRQATQLVLMKLGSHADEYISIQDEATLIQYIDACIKNGYYSIDTETTSKDPMLATLAGVCLYTYRKKPAYVPVNHISPVTNQRLTNQLSQECVKGHLQRLSEANCEVDMFNAKFDQRVLWNTLGVRINATWDGYIAARLLNENEKENNLKALHVKYCRDGVGDAMSFGDLFDGIPFTMVPLNVAYLYAANDAKVTTELCDFQRPFLTPGTPECQEQNLEGVAKLFHTIEMPLIPIVAEMEDTGIYFDDAKCKALSVEYNQKLKEEAENNFSILTTFGQELDAYRARMGAGNKLDYPVNLNSPTQVAIMLYDILKIPPVDPQKPRGTGEDILEKIDHPVAKSLLRYREMSKLLGTYIDKMPNMVNPKTGRIHASFNQMGADTGRFSSSDPNMQNIPAKNKDIRKMFAATPGYVMLSSDYSAQEPRLTAHMSQDEKMIQAYRQGRDLYVEIASIAFGKPYDECKEHFADGTVNPEGKKRRQAAKAIVLGVCYGKGVPAIAEDLGISKQKAQEIYDKIMKGFPGLQKFMDDSEAMARKYGFVTTVWGRKRRLPNIQLPPYEFTSLGSANFDPLADPDEEPSNELDDATIRRYTAQLNAARGYKQRQAIVESAKKQGILIKDNGGYIAEAKRQTVNSRIQGSAADQTKIAMILIGNDKQLREWGFRLLLPVHDELIGECPEENAKVVAERYSQLMIEAAKDLDVPSKCDVEISYCWYGKSLDFE